MSGDRDDYDVRSTDQADDIEVDCECGHRFLVPKTLRAGLTNCPRCRRATQVPGGPEALFWWLLGGGIALAMLLALLFSLVVNIAAGLITLGVCGLIILICVLAS